MMYEHKFSLCWPLTLLVSHLEWVGSLPHMFPPLLPELYCHLFLHQTGLDQTWLGQPPPPLTHVPRTSSRDFWIWAIPDILSRTSGNSITLGICWKSQILQHLLWPIYFSLIVCQWTRSPFCLYSPLPPLRGQPLEKLPDQRQPI